MIATKQEWSGLMNAHLVMDSGSTQFVELGIIHSRAKTIKTKPLERVAFFLTQILNENDSHSHLGKKKATHVSMSGFYLVVFAWKWIIPSSTN